MTKPTLNEIRDAFIKKHKDPTDPKATAFICGYIVGFNNTVAEMKKRVEKTWIEMHREIDNSCDDESVLEMIDWALEEYRKSVE